MLRLLIVALLLVAVQAKYAALTYKFHDESLLILDRASQRLLTFEASVPFNDVAAALPRDDCVWNKHAGALAACLFEDSSSCPEVTCAGVDVVFQPARPFNHNGKPVLDQDWLALLDDEEFMAEAKRVYLERQATKRDYPYNAVEMMSDSLDGGIGWAYAFLTNHFGTLHEFPTYSTGNTGIYHLNSGKMLNHTGQKFDSEDTVRVACMADFGAGTKEADYNAKAMMINFTADWTWHLGDVYYVGTEAEIDSNIFGKPPANTKYGVTWPMGELGTFAVNGNHEMYSRGYGYFDYWMPQIGAKDEEGKQLGQETSYFMLENDYWRVVALDTGYETYGKIFENEDLTQNEAVIKWLTDVAKIGDPTDMRGIIFLSHHQYFSAYEEGFPQTAQQLSDILPGNRTYLWLWGHEHRLSFYDLNNNDDIDMYAYGRCLGTGGFPVSHTDVPDNAKESKLLAYDDRVMDNLEGFYDFDVGFNGYTRIKFDRNMVTLTYKTLKKVNGTIVDDDSTTVAQETFQTMPGLGNVQQIELTWSKHLTLVDQL